MILMQSVRLIAKWFGESDVVILDASEILCGYSDERDKEKMA